MALNKADSFNFCFVLDEGYSSLSLALMLEVLNQSNHFLQMKAYQYVLVSDQTELLNNDEAIAPISALDEDRRFNMVVLLGGKNPSLVSSPKVNRMITTQYANGAWLAGLEQGVYSLARLGLLNKKSVSCHCNDMGELFQHYPSIKFNHNIFSFDECIYTCAGGLATADMMLDLIDKITPLASEGLYSHFVIEKPRAACSLQKGFLNSHNTGLGKSLMDAVELMTSNLSEPLEMQEIAYHSGVSTRQLERLFQKHFSNSPKKFYLQLRLKQARNKIMHSSCSIFEVALSCGFTAPTHFSKCYKDFFGLSPRQDRIFMLDQYKVMLG